jgi:hypothetical protein
MPTSYQDEKRLLDYLVQRLEERLAGRHETEILRTHPDDHCQLGVLAPWTQELDAEEQPDEIIPGPSERGRHQRKPQQLRNETPRSNLSACARTPAGVPRLRSAWPWRCSRKRARWC